MPIRNFSGVSRALIIAAFGLLIAPAVQGAGFRVAFDPQFQLTGSFANLGFTGGGDLTVDDGCLSATGEAVPGSGTCGFAFFTSLTLDLYNYTDGPSTILETLTYAPPNQPVGGVVSHVIISPPGQLVGIDTVFFGPLPASAITAGSGADPLPNNSHISMEFVSNFTAVPFFVDPNVILRICDTYDRNCVNSTVHAIVTFSPVGADTAVPEPASALLVLTGLGALGFARRRRARLNRD